MKKEFERIWNDPKCRMPLNLIWWHDEEFGYKEVDGLWYSKGKRHALRRPRRTYSKFKKFN